MLCLLLIVLSSAHAPGQDLVIANGRILNGTGAVLERGSVVVRDGRIVSVFAVTPDARRVATVDARGMTVIPGMIDSHVHLLLVDPSLKEQQALDKWIEQVLPADLKAYLEQGFTTILSNGDHPDSILRVKQRLQRGALSGPRLLVSGPVFTAPGGHPATTICNGFPNLCRESLAVEVDEPARARAKVRELANAGVDAIKAVYESVLTPGAKLADDVLAAIGEEAALQRLPLIVHPGNAEDALRAIELGADRLAHAPVRGTTDPATVAKKLTAASIAISTTMHGRAPIRDSTGQFRNHGDQPYTAAMEARMHEELRRLRIFWDNGVTIAFGTDRARGKPAVDLLHEIETLNRTLSAAEVLAALTLNGAQYLGLSHDIGSLEPGKVADIVIVEGDPLARVSDLANVKVVIQGGRIVVDNR
jgi:imidazolonepropionase-like amidohydrolase